MTSGTNPASKRRVPPEAGQFRKGQSGNPKGRPRGSRNKGAPYETILGQLVAVRSDEGVRKIAADEAFLLHMTRRGLDGDASAARATLEAIEAAPANKNVEASPDIAEISSRPREHSPHNPLDLAIRDLNMAVKLDACRDTARVVIEPWLVELALQRLGAARLDLSQQEAVWRGTRTPWKVNWPDWWAYRG